MIVLILHMLPVGYCFLNPVQSFLLTTTRRRESHSVIIDQSRQCLVYFHSLQYSGIQGPPRPYLTQLRYTSGAGSWIVRKPRSKACMCTSTKKSVDARTVFVSSDTVSAS